MIERYATPDLIALWSEKSKYEIWLYVELNVAMAYAPLNADFTPQELAALLKNAKVDVARIEVLELETKHDVIAFTRQVSETLGAEKRWLHYGLTSTDIVDTAQSCRLKMANQIITQDLINLQTTLSALANRHRHSFMIGRTHGMHAEVTSFGYKLAVWVDELNRLMTQFKTAAAQVEVAKISGAVGNYAHIPLEVQESVARALNLTSSKIASQTLQRDRHALYLFTLSLIATSLDKFATELRHLQRTEVAEVAEGFSQKQKGSSAMPHKQNPISSENISGLARVMRGYVTPALEDVALWHERDISHSSVERIILPDATTLLVYMLRRFNQVLTNLVVNTAQMRRNIELTHEAVFSQRAMLAAMKLHQWSREKAYDLIQPLALKALHEKTSFIELLVTSKIFTKEQAKELSTLAYYAQNVDAVFARLGL